MLFRRWLMGVCLEGVGSGGAGEGTGGAAADPPAAPGAPFAVFPTQAAFNERMQRATRAELRAEFGTDDPAEIKKKLKKAEELEAAEAERARKQLTEEQRLQSDLNAANARATAAEEERNQVKFEAHVSRVCARLSIPNIDYALYEVARVSDKLPAGQELDVEAHLKGLLEKPVFKAALGITEAPTVVQTGVTTTPDPSQSPPAPAHPGGVAGPTGIDASKMTKEQFKTHLAGIGVG